MAKRNITPEYFTCVEGSSNKFYVICEMVDKSSSITGWGPNKPNDRGQWKKISRSKAANKKNEKIRGGYTACSSTDIPWAAVEALFNELRKDAPDANISQDGKGGFIVADGKPGDGNAPPAGSPSVASRHGRALRKYHVWI